MSEDAPAPPSTREVDALRASLDEARAELLASLDEITQEQFIRRPPGEPTESDERWPARDVVWHAGLVEDWFRRVIDQGMHGRAIDRYQALRRPAHLNTPALLREWLDQTRRPLAALLRRLHDDDLDREFTLPEGEVRTARRLLTRLVAHDREHAEQVRALRTLPPPEER